MSIVMPGNIEGFSHYHIYFPQCTIIVFLLQMRKLRFKEIKKLAQGLRQLLTVEAFIFTVQLMLLHFSGETSKIDILRLVFYPKESHTKPASSLAGWVFIFIIGNGTSKVCKFFVEWKISVHKSDSLWFKIITKNYEKLVH